MDEGNRFASVLASVCDFNCTGAAGNAENLDIKAWQSFECSPRYPAVFPESYFLKNKSDVAVGFTGSGSRSYLCAVGYLAGFQELGLINSIKYIGGCGGAAWAVIAFSYSQLLENDTILLGNILPPQDLTIAKLNEMHPSCMRAFPSRGVLDTMGMHEGISSSDSSIFHNLSDIWGDVIFDIYLKPVGIERNSYFSWSKGCVEDIKQRNPSLIHEKFLTISNPQRPFPIIGTTLVGPNSAMPYETYFLDINAQVFYFLEITPLYVGNFHCQTMLYNYDYGEERMTVGGVVEPIGIGTIFDQPCFEGLAKNQQSGQLSIPKPYQIFDLKQAVVASSYAPEALLEATFVMKDEGALALDYWSCVSEKPTVQETLFADGCHSQSIPLISFLQRRVRNIILFFDSSIPLKTEKEWNVERDSPEESQIDKGFSAYFGIFPSQRRIHARASVYKNNQVFSRTDYIKVIKGFQEALKNGKPIVFTSSMTTVENLWWGIPAGIEADITFSYLGEVQLWEDVLPAETKVELRNINKFPCFSEQDIFNSFSNLRANLLCNLAGWTVTSQKELFQKCFSSNSDGNV